MLTRRSFLSRLFEGAVLGTALALGVRPEPRRAEVVDWTPADLSEAERRIWAWYRADHPLDDGWIVRPHGDYTLRVTGPWRVEEAIIS